MTRVSRSGPTVFVSYSHESSRHNQQVLDLANRLRTEIGSHSVLDLYFDHTVSNWPLWMRRQLTIADFVVMVFTSTYRRRFDGKERAGTGKGVIYEGSIITNMIYSAAGSESKIRRFIPVVFRESDIKHVPQDVFSGNTFILDKHWDRFRRFIQKTPTVVAPSIQTDDIEPPIAPLHPLQSEKVSTHVESEIDSIQKRRLSVLFIGAERGTWLDLQGQLKSTKAAIRKGTFGSACHFTGLFNLTIDRIVMEINSRKPDVLHLSGKQDGGQILFHDRFGNLVPVSADRLAGLLLDLEWRPRLIVLDTCFSLRQARLLARKVDLAIGVQDGIAEPIAIDFFAMFYNSLANGASVRQAFQVATGLELAKLEGDPKYRNEIEQILEVDFRPDLHLPRLVVRKGLRAEKVFLISEDACPRKPSGAT